MFTESVVLSLYFETPLQAAAGGVLGSIDVPIQRERTTLWPTVHAAYVEDAIRSALTITTGEDTALRVMGAPEVDGEGRGSALSVGDARVLLFSVRSSAAPFLWLTCPAVLSRLRRDMARTVGLALPPAPAVKADEIVTTESWKHGDETLAVEEIVLKPKKGFDASQLVKLVPGSGDGYEGFADEVGASLGVVSDEVFTFLVRTATQVQSTAGEPHEMVEEAVPPDCLFYVPIAAVAGKAKPKKKDASPLQAFESHVGVYLRVGQGEKLGRGWARTALLKKVEGEA